MKASEVDFTNPRTDRGKTEEANPSRWYSWQKLKTLPSVKSGAKEHFDNDNVLKFKKDEINREIDM